MTEKSKEKLKKVPEKTCFLITPIGSEGSLIRNRVDQWMELIYEPVLGKEYKIIRADKISAPGVITEQIIQNIIDADLVIIDYTGTNSNVMYEAAIRHLTDKPYIQIHESGVRLPFDIHNLRSIPYDPTFLDYPQKLLESIKESVKEINKSGYKSPQIIKEKFDLEKIVSDPDKFASALSKYIKIPHKNNFTQEEGIVTIAEPAYYDSGVLTVSAGKKIVCPRCKTIKYENSWDSFRGIGTNTSILPSSSVFSRHHYKCNNCGTEFEQ